MVKSQSLDKDGALTLVRKIESNIPKLKASSDKSGDLLDRALEKWQSTSKNQRKAALLQSLEQQETIDPRISR